MRLLMVGYQLMNKEKNMFRRIIPVFAIALVLSLVLAACGEEATVPSYSGATSLTVPDTLKTQFRASVKDAKNIKLDAYKTGDETGKAKAFFTDNFKQNDW